MQKTPPPREVIGDIFSKVKTNKINYNLNFIYSLDAKTVSNSPAAYVLNKESATRDSSISKQID